MLTIGNKTLQIDDYCITHYYDGFDVLDFDISVNDEMFSEIVENNIIVDTGGNSYRITKIDGSNTKLHVSAELNLRDFQTRMYTNYDNGSKKLLDAVSAFIPRGWNFVNQSGSQIYRTLRVDAGTPLDLLKKCEELYKVVFKFDVRGKVFYAINPNAYSDPKAFVTEELNLRQLNFYGDSTGLITRLEARGKDDLTFADINSGKTYVENYTYTSDIIYGFWKDERYTDKQSLLNDAQEKLAALANPARSYECDVIDLKSIDPDKYRAQNLSLYKWVSLKDVRRNVAYTYQVVEVKEHPTHPERNVITLATKPPKISQKLDEIENTVEYLDEMKPDEHEVNSAIEEATAWITGGAEGGHVYFIRDSAGKPQEIVILDNENINLANHVWRFNVGGFGHSSTGYNGNYTTAITQDGKIVADFITTGKLESTNDRFEIDLDNGTIVIKNRYEEQVFYFDGYSLEIMGTIRGSAIAVGGANNYDGYVTVANAQGNEVARLDKDGLTATAGVFSGEVNASSGSVGGWDIRSGEIVSQDSSIALRGGLSEIQIGDASIWANSSGDIYIVTDGKIYMGTASGPAGSTIIIDPTAGTIDATII